MSARAWKELPSTVVDACLARVFDVWVDEITDDANDLAILIAFQVWMFEPTYQINLRDTGDCALMPTGAEAGWWSPEAKPIVPYAQALAEAML